MERSMRSTVADNRKLFTGIAHAESYHRFRPTYPAAVFDTILDYLASSSESSGCKMAKKYGMAIDMACGTGQATVPLAPHFSKVIGCDISESQIDEATRHNKLDNVEYRVAPAEAMPFVSDGSVDLVTCALAFHWVDSEVVYPEVTRILRNRGVLAIYAYGLPVLGTAEARALYDELLEVTLKSFISPQVNILFNQYRDVRIPLDDVTRKDDLTIEMDVSLSYFIGYLSSYSPYRALLEVRPDSDVLWVLSDRLKAVLDPEAKAEDDPTIHVSFPVFILMGRKNSAAHSTHNL